MSIRHFNRLRTASCTLAVVLVGCTASPQAKEAKYLKRGEALFAKQDYKRALLEFRNAVNAMPNDAEPYYRMGIAYLATGEVANAVQALQKATALNPKHAGAQLKLAGLMTGSRDETLLKDAVSRLVNAYGPSPDDPEAIDTLALAEWKLGKSEDASQRLEEALKKFPTHLQSSVGLARMRLSRNDWLGAEEVLKKAVADAPRSSQAAVALAQLYVFLRQPAKAEGEFNRALQLDSKNGAALMGLANVQIAAKRIDEAEQTYKRAAALPDRNYKPLHAMFLFLTGKREAALAEFEALANADPGDRAGRSRLVAAYFQMNRVADAEKVLAAALKQNPKDIEALMQRAEGWLRAGRIADAEKDLRQVLHFNPDSASVHLAMSVAYKAKGLRSNERQELEQALRLNAGLLPARLALARSLLTANQAKAALDVIDQAPAQKQHPQLVLGRNWVLLALGRIQEAKSGIDEVLRSGTTTTGEAVFQNAVVKYIQRDYAGARAGLEELLKRKVTDIRVARLLMETYAVEGQVSKGLARLEEIAAGESKPALLQYLLGQWYARKGNHAEAKKAFEKAKIADSAFAPADLALAEFDIQEGRLPAARQRLAAVVTADPKNVTALLLAARAEDQAGNRQAVLSKYRAVLSVDGSNVIALNNLAYYLASDNADEALKFAQQAAEISPDSPHVQDTLGWIYYRKGLYSSAIRYLKNAVDKEPNPRRQFHLGVTYLKSGDRGLGQTLVQTALRQDPSLLKTEQGW